MEQKVRVINGPIPTAADGATLAGGIGWYPGSVYDARVYIPALTSGTRPVPADRLLVARESLLAAAKRILEKDRAIFRGLA